MWKEDEELNEALVALLNITSAYVTSALHDTLREVSHSFLPQLLTDEWMGEHTAFGRSQYPQVTRQAIELLQFLLSLGPTLRDQDVKDKLRFLQGTKLRPDGKVSEEMYVPLPSPFPPLRLDLACHSSNSLINLPE